MRISRIYRVFRIILVSVIGLLALALLLINLPFSHTFITGKVNKIFVSANLPIKITSVKEVFPGSLFVEGLSIHSPSGDTIIYAGKVRAGFRPLAFVRKTVMLTSVDIAGAEVNFIRNSEKGKLNIIEAFSAMGKTPETIQDSLRKPWNVIIGKFHLSDIRFRMADSVTGIFICQDIKEIKGDIKKMSLIKKYVTARSLEIEGATGSMILYQKPDKAATDSGAAWNFGIGEFSARDINFIYDDPVKRQKLDLLAGEIKIRNNKTDLQNKLIDFKEVSVSRTNAGLYMDKSSRKGEKEESVISDVFPWKIRGGIIKLQDISGNMADYMVPSVNKQASGFTFLGLGMTLSGLLISNDALSADLEKLNFNLGNGFSLKEMRAKVSSHSGHSGIDLEVRTANSEIKLAGSAEGEISDILKSPARMGRADLTISKSRISLEDIFYFRPDLQKISFFGAISGRAVTIAGNMKVVGSAFTLPELSLSVSPGAVLLLHGEIADVFAPRNSVCDLKFSINDIDHAWFSGLLQRMRTGPVLPYFGTLAIAGTVTDSVKSPLCTVNLNSDLGNIELRGSLDPDHDKYSLRSEFNNVMLGKILNDTLLGSLTASSVIEFSGIKRKAIYARAVVLIDSIGFKGYNYKKSEIECFIQPGKYRLRLKVNDNSLLLNLTAGADQTNNGLTGKADASILADLNNLHFSHDSLIAEVDLSASLYKKGKAVETGISIQGIKFTSPHDSTEIRNITGSLKMDSLNTQLAIKSGFLNAEAEVKNQEGSVGRFLKNYTGYLRALIDPLLPDSLRHLSYLPEFESKISLSYDKSIQMLVPEEVLKFKYLALSVKTNVAERTILYNIAGEGLKYKTVQADNLSALLADSSANLDLDLKADSFLIGGQLLKSIRLKGHFFNWQGLTELSIHDNRERLIYGFEISSVRDSDKIRLGIPSGELTLNRTVWHMDTPYFLLINTSARSVSPSFKMQAGGSSISLLKKYEQGWQSYDLELNKVNLSSLFPSETLPGKPEFSVSGSVRYGSNKTLGERLVSELQFRDIHWSDINLEDMSVNSSFHSDTAGKSDFMLYARSDTSEVNLKGKREGRSNLDISSSFQTIPINMIQPFVSKYLSDLKGNISGDFSLSSQNSVNNFTGNLVINDGNLRVNTLNSAYRLPFDRLKFSGEKMIFNDFKVVDSLNNELTVEGSVNFSNKGRVIADLEITSSNLQILNRKEENNSSFYGNIFIDSKISVRGPVTSPVLKGTITLAKGTNIYISQKENFNLQESEKTITFVSNRTPAGQKIQNPAKGPGIYGKTSIESVITIDPSTLINISLSKRLFNIELTVKGGGILTYNMLVNSQVNLTGKYEIRDGSANLKMVGWPIKTFKLTRGGYILWNGNLNDPELNVEAANTVHVSYLNPVDNKERSVDVDVTLKISKRLSALDVQFKVNTPDPYLMSIINTLSPEEQMRQALTILLFESVSLPGISTSSNYVTEQVNQMVASQLNQLTKTTIQGVDISFGIDTYTQGTISGGQETRTSLSYEVKKKLLNNRAQFEFSGRINDASNQVNSADVSLNNFSFEFRLDSLATKFLKVYNEHSYEDVFEGEVVKTGVGFTFRRSYPALRDIWKKEEKKNASKDQDK